MWDRYNLTRCDLFLEGISRDCCIPTWTNGWVSLHDRMSEERVKWYPKQNISCTLRILGMSWGVKNTCFEAPGVSLGGSGVSIWGVRILRVKQILVSWWKNMKINFNAFVEPVCQKSTSPKNPKTTQICGESFWGPLQKNTGKKQVQATNPLGFWRLPIADS